MDPQKLSQLDPKLREAYQRVMETSIPQPQASPPQAQAPTQPISEPQPAITPAEVSPVQNSPNFTSPAPETQTMAVKKKNGMMPILIGIAALVFVAVYTLFWTKIFNFKLPFLP